jgi:hypothetical protein
MQIPTEWYVHILPGIIIIFAFFIVAKTYRQKLLMLIQQHTVGSAVVLGICAYLVGFSENAILLFAIRPAFTLLGIMDPSLPHATNDWVTFYQLAPQALIDASKTGYQNMLLYRSLFGASLLLCAAFGYNLFAENSQRRWRVVCLLIAVLLAYSLHQNWWYTRAGYMQFTSQALKVVLEKK